MGKWIIAGAFTVAVAWSSQAFGRSLLCNRDQTKCVTDSKDFTIGDRVGVFNGAGQLVAVGKVKAMRGERRAFRIKRRMGRINKGYNVSLLNRRAVRSGQVEVYRQPPKISVGGSAGLATVGIGDGSSATEVTGFGEWHQWRGVKLVGRGVYTAIEGDISRYSDTSIETRPLEVAGFGLLGGASYTAWEQGIFSVRGELSGGFMYTDAVIDGDPGLVAGAGFDSKVDNGFGLYGRGEVGALWNMGPWSVKLAVAENVIQQALGTSLSGGVVKKIK